MLLSASPGSFAVDYTYNAGALGTTGLYGYSVPGSQFETTGPLANQHYVFTTGGSTGAVPEPATWMTMLLGFGLIGLAIRCKPRLPVAA